MSVDKPTREPIDWKARGLDWLFSQGISTILLLMICAGMWYGIPWARTCMKDDIREIHAAHKDTFENLIKTWDAHGDRQIKAFQDDQARDQKEKDRLWQKLGIANQDAN